MDYELKTYSENSTDQRKFLAGFFAATAHTYIVPKQSVGPGRAFVGANIIFIKNRK